jgi:hypothetical protein
MTQAQINMNSNMEEISDLSVFDDKQNRKVNIQLEGK